VEGTVVPFFIKIIMNINEIKGLISNHLAGTDKFLVELLVNPGNRIYVFIDGDHGVTISDCVELSRFVESQLDREAEDFELNVSSSGADQPIKLPRQYLKNIGRSLQVKLSEENSVSGKLEAVNEKGIVLTTSGDKKKKLPPETLNIPYESMVESKVIISFK
jgi:ribosome maturation factor RimP